MKTYSVHATIKNIPLKTIGKLEWLFLNFSLKPTKIVTVVFSFT